MSTTPPSPTARSAASSPNTQQPRSGARRQLSPGTWRPGGPWQDHDRAHRPAGAPVSWHGRPHRPGPPQPTRSEAIGNAARVAAARAVAKGTVGGRLWDDDGAALLAAADRLPRRTVAASGPGRPRQAMEEPSTVPAGDQHQPPGEPVPPGGQGGRDPAARAPERPGPSSSRPPPVDPHGLPGPRLGELDAAAAAGLWGLLAELRRGQVTPPGQLLRLTRRLPVELAGQLLSVLDGGPALVRAEAVRVREAADPHDPATRPWPWLCWVGWKRPSRPWPPGPAPRSCRSCWVWPARKATWASGALLGFTSAAQGPCLPG